MWNGVRVCDRCCCVKSTFSPAFPLLFLNKKVYTPPFPKGIGGGKIFVVDLLQIKGYDTIRSNTTNDT